MIVGVKKYFSNFLVLFSVILLISCDERGIFDSYKPVENCIWQKDGKFTFYFDANDTISKYNLFINLRNNNDYEFSNLYLVTQLSFPNGKQIIDTLEYNMTDNFGKFLGNGFSEIKENKLVYKENVIFPLLGTYSFSVRHAMRRNSQVKSLLFLKGVTDIGFRIEK